MMRFIDRLLELAKFPKYILGLSAVGTMVGLTVLTKLVFCLKIQGSHTLCEVNANILCIGSSWLK